MSDHSVFGHNQPPPPKPLDAEQIREWLAFELDPLRQRIAEIAAALNKAHGNEPTIETDEQLAAFADNIRMAKAAQRTAEERRKDAKQPFLDGGREIDAWFRDAITPLEAPVQAIQKSMDAYQARIAAEARKRAQEEARIARAKAEAAAAEAARHAFAARETEEQEAAAAEAIAKAERAAKRADAADAKADGSPSGLVRRHTDLGTVTTARESLEFEIVDPEAVPRRFMVVDQNRIRAALRDLATTPAAKADLRMELEAGRQPFPGINVQIVTKALVR